MDLAQYRSPGLVLSLTWLHLSPLKIQNVLKGKKGQFCFSEGGFLKGFLKGRSEADRGSELMHTAFLGFRNHFGWDQSSNGRNICEFHYPQYWISVGEVVQV